MRALTRAAIWVVALLSIVSCSVDQNIVLEEDLSGTADLRIAIHPVLSQYLYDLSVGVGGAPSLFDLRQIELEMARREGLSLESMRLVSENELELRVRFDNVEEVLRSNADVEPFVTVRRVGNERILRVSVGPQLVAEALGLIGADQSEAVEFVLPPEGSNMDVDEYAEYLAWALEEYEEDEPVIDVLTESSIDVALRPSGPIVYQRPGEPRGAQARWDIGVLDMLTRQDDVVYELRYRD